MQNQGIGGDGLGTLDNKTMCVTVYSLSMQRYSVSVYVLPVGGLAFSVPE